MATTKAADKRGNIRKEPRVIRMSHRAYLTFKRIADEREIGIGGYFELLAVEEGTRHLSADARAEIAARAQEIIDERTRELEAADQPA